MTPIINALSTLVTDYNEAGHMDLISTRSTEDPGEVEAAG